MADLHVWITGDQLWCCHEYDHGPFCRNCRPIDTILVAPGSKQNVLGIIDQPYATPEPPFTPCPHCGASGLGPKALASHIERRHSHHP